MYDAGFQQKVNTQSTELPLRDGNIVDLHTLHVRERVHTDYWSYELEVMYKIDKDDTDKFVHTMMLDFCNNDKSLLRYLQGIFGVGLTREALRLKKMFIFYGAGNNGKSAAFDWARNVHRGSPNFVDINATVLMAEHQPRAGRATPQLMDLPNARIACFPDPAKDMEFSDDMVKRLTGGDPMKIRQLHQKEQPFMMRGVICGHTNHRPKLQNMTDKAAVGRVVEFPCLATFVKNDANNKKCERMLQPKEQDALFSWMARGAEKFLKLGSLGKTPDAITKAGKDYLKEQDTVSQWIDAACETGNHNDVVKQSELYGLYCNWCDVEDKHRFKKPAFIKQMKILQSQYKFEFKKSGEMKVLGLKVTPKPPPKVLYQSTCMNQQTN